jgi:hypothetical protein
MALLTADARSIRQRHYKPTILRFISAAAVASVVALVSAAGAMAQAGGNPELTEKLAALKEASAANKQRLQQYTWTETQQLTLKGDPKPAKTFQCEYGPDGSVQKTPVGAPAASSGGGGRQGRLKQHIVEKKTDEMKDYMQQVQGVIALYVPPDPQRMQSAFKAGNVSINKGGAGLVNLIFVNYAQQGDKMTIGFDTTSKKVQTVNVNTYLDDPKDVVTLAVQFASLPDGTNYQQQTVLNATAKQLQVTNTNSNYAKRMQ